MIQPITGSAYLRQLVLYERWRTPFNPVERRNALLSGPAILLGGILVGALLSAQPDWLARSDFLLALCWTLVVVDAAALVTYAVLCLETDGLSGPASADWHDAAFAVSIVGAINASLLALVAAAIVVIVVLYVIMAVLIVVVGIAVLLRMASGSNN